jgi:phage baseplate assembly protein W
MAFGAQKIFPIDTKPGTAVGTSLNFNDPGVFLSTYTTKDAIKNNLINFFLTNRTERYLNPNFGGDLRKYIFEQINSNNLDFLKQDIQNQIGLYFPSVIVASLDVIEYTDNNQIVITLKYTIADTNISDQLDIAFN